MTVRGKPYGAVVEAPASRLSIELDAATGRVALAIDGRRTAEEIRRLLASEGAPLGLAEVEAAISLLDAYFLLDNERGRARAAAPPAPPAPLSRRIRVLPGARFCCDGNGYCCSNGQSFGPISEEDRKKILAHDWTGWIPGVRAPTDLFYDVSGPSGKTTYLRQRDGRCVFLTDDNLCAIHKRLGAEAKPWVCRVFPLTFAETPAGVYVASRSECRCVHRSRRTGTPIADQICDLEALLAEVQPPVRVETLVLWARGVVVPFEVADAVRSTAIDILSAPGPETVDARILAVRDVVVAVHDRLGARPGEADFEAALGLARDPMAARAAARPREPYPGAAWVPARAALVGLLEDLVQSMMRSYFLSRDTVLAGPVRLLSRERAITAILLLLSRLSPPPPVPGALPSFGASALATVALESDPFGPVGGAFLDALRNDLFGWTLIVLQPFFEGIVLATLRHVIAKWIALRLAAGRGAEAVSVEDACEGLVAAAETLRHTAHVRLLTKDRSRLTECFRGLRFGPL